MQLAITSTFGTEKSRHLPPTSYTVTAATSVFPLPVGPPIQYPLHPLSKVPCANHTRYDSFFHFWRAILYLPMGIAMLCLHIGWIWVQPLTSCSSSTFPPQFHGNLWHFQDVTSTFFTSRKKHFPHNEFNISFAVAFSPGEQDQSPHLFAFPVSFS